jgi:hypothetical protein
MLVWSDGKTVRGYKANQFSDAFAQLGVRSVRNVRGEARREAPPNGPNASNASTPEEHSNGHYPIPGDSGYLEHLFAAHEARHVTEGEWHQLSGVHRKLAKAVA